MCWLPAPSLCTAAFVYKKFHTRKGAVIGLALGTVCLTVVIFAVELSHHAHLHGNGSRGNRGPHADPSVPALQPGEGRPEYGADPALLYKPVVTALRKARLVPESHAPVEGKGKLSAGFLLFSLALLATFVVLALVLMGIL